MRVAATKVLVAESGACAVGVLANSKGVAFEDGLFILGVGAEGRIRPRRTTLRRKEETFMAKSRIACTRLVGLVQFRGLLARKNGERRSRDRRSVVCRVGRGFTPNYLPISNEETWARVPSARIMP